LDIFFIQNRGLFQLFSSVVQKRASVSICLNFGGHTERSLEIQDFGPFLPGFAFSQVFLLPERFGEIKAKCGSLGDPVIPCPQNHVFTTSHPCQQT
jgi:hypothetical protein